MSSYRGMDASLLLGFALCCHSNATRAPIANPPNSTQVGSSLYHAPSYIWVRAVVWAYGRGQTDRHTDRQTRMTTIHFASSTTHAECNYCDVSGVEEDIGTVAVHWSPEACIADTQASEGGLSKIMSAATNVRITGLPWI